MNIQCTNTGFAFREFAVKYQEIERTVKIMSKTMFDIQTLFNLENKEIKWFVSDDVFSKGGLDDVQEDLRDFFTNIIILQEL